jgi:hypothetical protein
MTMISSLSSATTGVTTAPPWVSSGNRPWVAARLTQDMLLNLRGLDREGLRAHGRPLVSIHESIGPW